MAKVLVVEDDEDTASLIKDALEAERHIVEVASDGRSALDLLKEVKYELIILDWTLPIMDGNLVLKEYRNTGGTAGVIMLTGKSDLKDKEVGFDCGVDDYVTKPFDVRELVLRTRSILRRPPTQPTRVIKSGSVELDPVSHKLTKSGNAVHLAPRDFALLEFLMRYPNEIFSADALVDRVWRQESTASGEAVRMSISRIRKALDDDPDNSIIENVSRIGYRLRST